MIIFDPVQQAAKTAGLWCKQDAVILDTETTGVRSAARIVSIAIVALNGNVLFNSILNPGIPNPPEAIEVNHISNELLARSRTVQNAWPTIFEILEGRVILAYNADFDRRMLVQTAQALDLPIPMWETSWHCIMRLCNSFSSSANLKLSQVAESFGIPVPQAHNSLADAQLARQVVLHIANQLKE